MNLDKRTLGYIGLAVVVLVVGWFFFKGTKGWAADLGGNCCADLEERVAELEATTAKKGNRKVSLSLSGYVSHSVMWWDDSATRDVYIGDGGAISSRWRFTGEAKVSPTIKAGFNYEFGLHNNHLGSMNQGAGGDDLGGDILLRDSTVWLEHKQFGKVKIGHGSTATDNLVLVNLGGNDSISTPDVALFNGGFGIRTVIGGVNTLTPVTWAAIFNGGISWDTARRNHVLYETPSVMGFTVQAAVAEDNFWDVALRYAGEFGGFRVAGGVGYLKDQESPAFGPTLALGPVGLALSATDVTEWKGSASIMHIQTGLFLTGAAGQREVGGPFALGVSVFGISLGSFPLPATVTTKDPSFWHLSGGIAKNFFGIGNTVVYGEYHKAKDMIGLTGPGFSLGSDATMWGVGVVQHIDSAAMELFLAYKVYDADLTAALGGSSVKFNAEAFSAVVGGAKINF